jgi:hypothetical protein
MAQLLKSPVQHLVVALTSLSFLVSLSGCTSATTNQYEATALTRYTWEVEYSQTGAGQDDRRPRLQEFDSTSLLNVNGQRPDDAVTGPDNQGLWWPALPVEPTVDELEAQQRPNETIGTPKLQKDVQYSLTFDKDGQTVTLPTDYAVYRQIARVYPDQPPLELTLGVNESSVEKAEPKP